VNVDSDFQNFLTVSLTAEQSPSSYITNLTAHDSLHGPTSPMATSMRAIAYDKRSV